MVPQTPQLDVVLSGTSQPLAATPSQLPYPELHETSAQVPVWHEPVPLEYVHALLHMPQFKLDVLVFVSQPLLGLPSQLAKPIAHVGVHVPFVHDVVPLPFVHVTPHMPQFDVLLPVLISQPFAYMPSQFWNGAVHD